MSRRDRLVWGLVGALAFLVLIQAYELAVGYRAGIAVNLGVSVVVGLATVGSIALVGRRLGANESA